MAQRATRPDAVAIREDRDQYAHGPMTPEELAEKFPQRPRNIHKTPPFHELFKSLFVPLNENKNSKAGPARRGQKANKLSPHEQRKQIIQNFISRWRSEVGNDFYPALRLIVPDKDRDRSMYGLKEKAIAKLLIKMLKIGAKSDDGRSLTDWKVPGTANKAGDFPLRCHEVLQKRAMRSTVGDMSMAEVNILLDKLSDAQKEENQLPIFETFYNRMSAEEMTWLIRIILRQVKVGASEKTILELWHPDAESLFSISSSLRRVCWELVDPTVRLYEDAQASPIELMSCFQPQLAQFQTHSFSKMLDKLGVTTEHPEFWIEEKLDGERIQLHMAEEKSHPGGKRFGFWSRKAKDYTYLYGDGFEDRESALTRHIKDAFHPGVTSIILDGEMITWDPVSNKIVPFGTLKTAALSESRNPFAGSSARPVFRVFDCLYLNEAPLTGYPMTKRREALEKAMKNVEQRIEIHKYQVAKSVDAIDPALRKIVDESGEGLVLKNPRSLYKFNSRNDEWVKVKPEYMSGFGEELDCVVIGGYYGSGHRGGGLSSFLCGLKVSQNYRDANPGTHPEKCESFFKVGGGFRVEDYANIRHRLDGRWIDWDRNNPPDEYIKLGGGDRQYERPDVWIKPSDSIVLEVKAASVGGSDQFGTGFTLRFPRFKRIRDDKSWENALSYDEFLVLKNQAEEESKREEFQVDTKRKMTKRLKKELVVAGDDRKIRTPYAGPKTQIFAGLNFCVLSDMLKPQKKSKAEIEQIIKANGGSIFQNSTVKEEMIVLGEKNVIKVTSLIKKGATNIVRPIWVLDAIKQDFLVPFEPNHMFHLTEASRSEIEGNVDIYGDSYTRDLSPEELKQFFDDMILPKYSNFSPQQLISELAYRGKGDFGDPRASLFRGCVANFLGHSDALDSRIARFQFEFGGGVIADEDEKADITHSVIVGDDANIAKEAKVKAAQSKGALEIVSLDWVIDSWREGKRLKEETHQRFT